MELDIKHILTCVQHLQSNSKLEHLRGEIWYKLHHFEDISSAKIRCGITENFSVGRLFYTVSARSRGMIHGMMPDPMM